MLLFQNAISAYFAGNKQALDNCIKEFHIKIKNNEGKQPSFLEHWCCCGNICHLGLLIKDSVSCRHTWNWKDVWNFCLAKFCWCRKKQNYNIKWKEEFWLLCRMKWKEEFWLLCSMKIFDLNLQYFLGLSSVHKNTSNSSRKKLHQFALLS